MMALAIELIKKYSSSFNKKETQNLFSEDAVIYENIVKNAAIKVKVTQNQFDALVSFAYNIGKAPRKTVQNNQAACNKMLEYHYIHDKNGNPVSSLGLVRRRQAEINLFNKG